MMKAVAIMAVLFVVPAWAQDEAVGERDIRSARAGSNARATKKKGSGKDAKAKQKKALKGAQAAKARAETQAEVAEVAAVEAKVDQTAAVIKALEAQGIKTDAAGNPIIEPPAPAPNAAPVNMAADEWWDGFRECMKFQCGGGSKNGAYNVKCYDDIRAEDEYKVCRSSIPEEKWETMFKYWSKTYLVQEMTSVCEKKAGLFDELEKKCLIKVYFEQRAQTAEGKMDEHVGCTQKENKIYELGKPSPSCDRISAGWDHDCLDADKGQADAIAQQKKTAVIMGAVGIGGGIATGLVLGLTNKDCDKTFDKSQGGTCTGVGGKEKFGSAGTAAIITGVTGGLGSALPTYLVASGQKVGGGRIAPIRCLMPDATSLSQDELIDLSW